MGSWTTDRHGHHHRDRSKSVAPKRPEAGLSVDGHGGHIKLEPCRVPVDCLSRHRRADTDRQPSQGDAKAMHCPVSPLTNHLSCRGLLNLSFYRPSWRSGHADWWLGRRRHEVDLSSFDGASELMFAATA